MHTRNLFFFCTILLLTSSNTYTMQAPDLTIAKIKIPIPHNTNIVVPFGNNQILTSGLKGCTIIDISTPHSETKLHHLPCVQVITNHPTKAVYEVTNNHSAIIYDMEAKKQFLLPDLSFHRCKVQFINRNNSIISTSLTNFKTTLYNYTTSTQEEYTLLNDIFNIHPNINPISITHHPTKQEVAFANAKHEIHILDLVTKSCLQKIPLSNIPSNISYSCDGSSLRFTTAKGNLLTRHLLHIQSGKHIQRVFSHSDCTAWHPHGPYLVEASAQFNPNSPYTVKWWNFDYYNMKKNKIIGHNYIYHHEFTGDSQKIFFSTNNNSIIFFTGSECLIFDLPFEVIKKGFYPRGTEKKLILLHLILKNYLLPEIIKLLIQKTVKVTKL